MASTSTSGFFTRYSWIIASMAVFCAGVKLVCCAAAGRAASSARLSASTATAADRKRNGGMQNPRLAGALCRPRAGRGKPQGCEEKRGLGREIGRAACRERVWQEGEIRVGADQNKK